MLLGLIYLLKLFHFWFSVRGEEQYGRDAVFTFTAWKWKILMQTGSHRGIKCLAWNTHYFHSFNLPVPSFTEKKVGLAVVLFVEGGTHGIQCHEKKCKALFVVYHIRLQTQAQTMELLRIGMSGWVQCNVVVSYVSLMVIIWASYKGKWVGEWVSEVRGNVLQDWCS